MKKYLLLLLPLILTAGCAAPAADDYLPYQDIPADYSLKDAKRDNCVVYEDLNITAGQEVWDDFVEQAWAGEPCVVRLAFYYTLDDPSHYDPAYYAEIKDDYPVMYLMDLRFDGELYNIYHEEEGQAYSLDFKYLKKYSGDMPNAASYDRYTRYVLVDDDTVTWEQLEWGVLSSQFGAYIRHSVVYSAYE